MPSNSPEGISNLEQTKLITDFEVIAHDQDVANLDPFGKIDPEDEIRRLQEQDPGYLEQLMLGQKE